MRYLILGATEARDGRGHPVLLGGPRLRALLTALALHGDGNAAVPVDVLINEVWPTSTEQPTDAPAALQALVGRLRRTLGRDAIRSLPGGYRLHATPDEIDLHRFADLAQRGSRALEEDDPATAERLLAAALDLWRGPALADLPDRKAASARPEALREDAVRRRVAAEMALGRAAQVLPEVAELAAARPLDEPLHALHLRALRDTGRTAEALVAYEGVRRTIADRLGADPGTELRTLHAELLALSEPHPGPDAVSQPGQPGQPFASGDGTSQAPPPPPPGNLRSRLTSFVGRESDLETLRFDLGRSRLVTLTGPGGSGKTRLAEQAAAAATRHTHESGGSHTSGSPYRDGAWLAELARLDISTAVPGAVLSALGLRETTLFGGGIEGPRTGGATGHEPSVDATARLLEHCAHRRLLLVLDNCEHVIDAAASLAETLLTHCPHLTVVATSREPLGVPGETVRPVEPLPPEPAHRLFVERGTSARPDFAADASPPDRKAVAEICDRLDGLPLAIELAAARLRSLTPRQIADRLDDRFRLLSSGNRTVLPRQQTLRAVVDWSWDLLDDRERSVLRRISVFSGGCTLSAAEYVCAGGEVSDDAVLDVLAALVDKSILIADRPAAAAHTGVRYRMLETIHAYAKERAADHPDERERAETRHTEQISRFAAAAEPRLRSAEQLAWFPRVEADLDNIRAVLHRARQAGDSDTVSSLVRDMGWFWWLRNYRDEGGSWNDQALQLLPQDRADRTGRQELRYREFQMLRYFLTPDKHSQDLLCGGAAIEVAREAVAAFRRPLPESARFPGLLWPFTAYVAHGSQGVVSLMNICVTNCRALGGAWELAIALLFRAHVRVDTPGGLDRAAVDLPEIDTLSRATGDRWLLSQACALRAEIATMRGRYEWARSEYETALRHAEELGALTERPFLLARIAETWHLEGDSEQAELLAVQAVQDADRLRVTDAVAVATFLRAVIAHERGAPARARELHEATRKLTVRATLPSVFEVILASLGARITAAEGERHPRAALREIRDVVRRADAGSLPELAVAHLLLDAAVIALEAGQQHTALRLADGSRAMRGALPATVPEAREEARLRAAAPEHPPPQASPPGLATAAALLDAALGDTDGHHEDVVRDGGGRV